MSLCSVLRFIHYYAECRNAECHYAECHYAECRYVECRGAVTVARFWIKDTKNKEISVNILE